MLINKGIYINTVRTDAVLHIGEAVVQGFQVRGFAKIDGAYRYEIC